MRSASSFPYLLRIAQRGLPFTSSDGQAFVRLDEPSSNGFYILPIRSPAYRRWFFYQFFCDHNSLPTSQAFHALLDPKPIGTQCRTPQNQPFRLPATLTTQ